MSPNLGISMSSLLPRRSVDSSLHGSVDIVLKCLKLVARRISSSLAAFEDESRLLDRLFYKGKNQHRLSKFWRHVEEMRRFYGRLLRLNISRTVNRARHIFYSSTDYGNQNILKSSWTHVPKVRSLRTFIHGFRQTSKLLAQMSEKYVLAYWFEVPPSYLCNGLTETKLVQTSHANRLHALTLLLLEDHQELVSSFTNLCSSFETMSLKPGLTESLAIDPFQEPLGVFSISSTMCSPETPKPPNVENLRKLDSEKVKDEPKPKVQSEADRKLPKSTTKSYNSIDLLTEKPKKKKNKKPTDEIDVIFGF